MRQIVFAIAILAASTLQAATVASEVSDSVRSAYNDLNANLHVTRVMGEWNQKVLSGQAVDANEEIKYYVQELRKVGIDLPSIATPALSRLIKVNGL